MVAHTGAPLRAHRLRALNQPLPVTLELDDRGRPVTIGTKSRVGEVIEEWKVDDEWWRDPISRRYVEVALEGGGHVVLFEDLTSGNWFMQQP